MALNIVDRLQTIVVTATLTSAAWILVGSVYLRGQEEDSVELQRIDEERSQMDEAIAEVNAGDPAPSDGRAALADRNEVTAPAPSDTAQLIVPVQGVRPEQLSDTFSDDRGGGVRLHEALDIMADRGTSVIAAAPGTVEKMFRSDAGGLTVYVRSPDGETIYYYAHMDGYAEGLSEGQAVRRGQRLGTVGSTGNADPQSPHLHFAIMRTSADAGWWEPTSAVNPYPLLTR